MIYNGIDLSGYLDVSTYSGFTAAIPQDVSLFTPTLGAGSRIVFNKLPNYNITALVTIAKDKTTSLEDKLAYLRTVFVPGTEFVEIQFDESDDKIYMGRYVDSNLAADYFSVREYTLVFSCLPYRYGTTATVTGSSSGIVGINNGTAPALGAVSFAVSGSPESVAVVLSGTAGAVTLIPYGDDTLDGTWVIDLDNRVVTLDGDSALNFVSFDATNWESFEVPSSAYSITITGGTISNTKYVYRERYL